MHSRDAASSASRISLLQNLTPTSVHPPALIIPQPLRSHSFPVVGALVTGARRRARLAAFVSFLHTTRLSAVSGPDDAGFLLVVGHCLRCVVEVSALFSGGSDREDANLVRSSGLEVEIGRAHV